MPGEQMTIPTNEKGNIVFKSVEEYNKALEGAVQPNSNVAPNTLQALLNRDKVEIQPDPAPQPPPQAAAAPKPGESQPGAEAPKSTKLVEELRRKAEAQGLQFDYQNDEQLVDAVLTKEKHNRYLSGERDRMTQPSQPSPTTQPQAQPMPAASVQAEQDILAQAGESKEAEINLVQQEIESLDPINDENKINALLKRKDRLMMEEMGRLGRIATASANGYKQLQQKALQDQSALRADIMNLRQTIDSTRDTADEDAMVSTFQRTHEEYRTTKSMSQLDKEFYRFGRDLHFLRHRENTDDVRAIRAAVADYMDGDIDLKLLADKNGVEMPKEMDKYWQNCELITIKMQLDKATGRKHTLDDALIYKLQSEGQLDRAMQIQRDKGAQAVTHEANKRDNDFARVIDANDTAPVEDNKIREQQAWDVINQWGSSPDAVRNPEIKTKLEEAYRVVNKVPTLKL